MGYDRRLYASVHRGNPGDVGFYERLCAEARTVLELGCGYGRVLSRLDDGTRALVAEQDALTVARIALKEALRDLSFDRPVPLAAVTGSRRSPDL